MICCFDISFLTFFKISFMNEEYAEKFHQDDNYVIAAHCVHYTITNPEGKRFLESRTIELRAIY